MQLAVTSSVTILSTRGFSGSKHAHMRSFSVSVTPLLGVEEDALSRGAGAPSMGMRPQKRAIRPRMITHAPSSAAGSHLPQAAGTAPPFADGGGAIYQSQGVTGDPGQRLHRSSGYTDIPRDELVIAEPQQLALAPLA